MQHFVDSFGKEIFQYFVILFTRKDDLDEEGRDLYDHIKSVPPTLQSLIVKCGGRVIAFNNRLKGNEGDEQVRELLSMILRNVERNNSKCYTNEMYIKAEKILQEREAEILKRAQMERDKELQSIKDTLKEEFSKEVERYRTKTKEEFQNWQEEFMKREKEERKAKAKQLLKEYDEKFTNMRDVVRDEVVEEQGILRKIWTRLA